MISKLKTLLILAIWILAMPLWAGEETITSLLKGSDINTTSFITIRDQYYGQTGSYTVADQKVIVQLYNNDAERVFRNSSWSLSVDYSMELKLSNGSVTTETGSLVITGNNTPNLTINPRDVKVFQGYAYGRLTITNVTYSEGTSADLEDDFHLEVSVVTQRFYDLTVSTIPLVTNEIFNSGKKTLDISWDFIPGAEEYELEWVFVADGTKTGTHAGSQDIYFDFINATRIQLNNTHYEIPMTYPKGSVIYRVRGIGYDLSKPDFSKHRIPTDWSYPSRTGNLNQASLHDDLTALCYFYFTGLDLDKNWTYTAMFAENGKRKEVAAYSDGSGRTRQQVTVNNSDGHAIVGETKYDLVGRPALQIIPVPVSNEGLKYYGDNANPFNGSFDYNSFATDPRLSDINSDGLPLPLPVNSEASKYYSSSNPLNFENKNAVPAANGFAYTFTQYTNDGLERPKVQSGLGDSLRYKAQGSRNTRYFYNSPTQPEIDRLFGNEAGLAKFYQKNMTVDPNGQQSIQYLDGEGKVVATGLSGDEPSNLDALSNQDIDAIVTPLFNGPKPKMTSDKLLQTVSYGPSEPNTLNINYDLTDVYLETCHQSGLLLSNIKYDMVLTARDERGVIVGQDSIRDFANASSISFLNFFADLGTYGISRSIKLNEAAKSDFLRREDSLIEYTRMDSLSCGPNYFLSGDTLCPALNCDTACRNSYTYTNAGVLYYMDTAGVTYEPDLGISGNYYNPLDPSNSWSEASSSAPWNKAIAACLVECEDFKDTTGGATVDQFFSEDRCKITSQIMYSDMGTYGQYALGCDTNSYCYNIVNLSGVQTNFDPYVGTVSSITISHGGGTLVVTNAVISNNTLCLDQYYGDSIILSSGNYLNEDDLTINLDHGAFFGEAQAICDSTDHPVFSNTNLSGINARLGTSFADWGELMANWSTGFDSVLIEYHPEYCAKDFFCNYEYICGGSPVTMDAINSFAGKLYRYADSAASFGVDFNYMNPLGLAKDASTNGKEGDNTSYIKTAGPGGYPIDPLVCPNATSGLGKYAYDNLKDYLENFIPVVTSGNVETGDYYSLWYLLDDPDNIAGSSGTLHPDLIKIFEMFHGGNCSPAAIQSYDDKLRTFRGIYLFLREMVIYNYFDDIYLCADSNLYTYWDYDTDYDRLTDSAGIVGYSLVYPRNLLYDHYGASTLVIQGLLEPKVQPDSLIAYYPTSRLDTCTCDNFITYLGTDATAANAVIAQRLLDDFCMVYGNDTITTLKRCAIDQHYNLMFLLPDSLQCSSKNQFLVNLAESCGALKAKQARDEAEFNFQKAKKTYMDSLSLAYDLAAYGALDTAETVTLSYSLGEYHYTLYYYDQAGNLVKTIPPAGVDVLSGTNLQNVENYRKDTANYTFVRPQHSYVTNYQYNSLNQVIAQSTPDGGTTYFWYDDVGRLVVSQNAEQASSSPVAYSYSLYDGLGRVVEAGEITTSQGMVDTIAADMDDFEDWIVGGTRSDVVFTLYDEGLYDVPGSGSDEDDIETAFGPDGQTYLRNRVASSYRVLQINPGQQNLYILNNYKSSAIPAAYLNYQSATHYSYDPHGNVRTLLQEFPDATLESKGRRFFKMQYEYDLVSGNVNQVVYQRGLTDQFIHRYNYDADNRLVAVETTRDGIVWEQEARYHYYPHGPLSRVEIGERSIQGLDYAYTLQGWLKSVNSTSLAKNGALGQFDLGSDGEANDNLNSAFAPDAFGFGLDYFENDLIAIGDDGFKPSITGAANLAVSGFKGLFNGNIGRMTVALNDNVENPIDVAMYNYSYDQLNRITAFNSFTQTSLTEGNTSNAASSMGLAANYTYDPNGNITALNRYDGSGSAIDNLTYYYDKNNPNAPKRNRLLQVKDPVGQVGDDLPDQTGTVDYINYANNNYQYDPIGNLVRDGSENLTVNWNVTGKVKNILKDNGDIIAFDYDASGSRIKKLTFLNGVLTNTYYVRDAQGNVMATYQLAGSTLNLKELNIYGSDRLGLITEDVAITNEIQNTTTGTTLSNTNRYVFNRVSGSPALLGEGNYMLEVDAISGPLTLTGSSAITAVLGNYTQNGDILMIPMGSQVVLSTSGTLSFSGADQFGLRALSGNATVQNFNGTYLVQEDTEAEQILGNKRYELKNHLGNILSTVSDRKVWKQIDGITTTLYEQGFTPQANETADLLDLEAWQPYEEGGVEYNDPEEGLLVYSNGGESGATRQFETNPYCYFKYCLTFSNIPEGTAISIYNNLLGGYIVENQQIEPSEGEVTHCWDISQYGSGVFDVYITLPEGQQLRITKEELFRTVMPAGWSSFGTPTCLKMNEGGVVIPYDEEGTPGIETTIAVDPGCDQRICFVISDMNGEGKLTVKDHQSTVIHTENFSEADSICLTITEGSYSSLTFVFEMTSGESFTLANVIIEEICSINTQVADVMSAQDYYPFGSIMPGRKFSSDYRYGFNGMERDDEVKNVDGSSLDFGARIYDSRIGRWMSSDPMEEKFPWMSPYNFANNNPIFFMDEDGNEGVASVDRANKTVTIKAVYFVELGKDGFNATEYKQLMNLGATLNSQGYTITDPASPLNGYSVQFDLQVGPATSASSAQSNAISESSLTSSGFTGGLNLIENGNNIGNSLILTDDKSFQAIPSIQATAKKHGVSPSGVLGITDATGQHINIPSSSRGNTLTQLHEIFHTLYFDNDGATTGIGSGKSLPTPADINQMMQGFQNNGRINLVPESTISLNSKTPDLGTGRPKEEKVSLKPKKLDTSVLDQ